MAKTNKKTILPREFLEQDMKESYAHVAWFYDLWGSITESKTHKKVLELAQIEDNLSILEVAVGTGKLFAEIVKSNPHGHNEGIDISPAMLAKAKKYLSHCSSTNYDLKPGNVYELEYQDGSFDLIICNYLVDMLPERDFIPIFKDFNRLLKVNGKLLISTFDFGSYWYHRFWYWLAKHFPSLLTGCRPVKLDMCLKKAGFENLTVEHISQNTFPSVVYRAEKGEQDYKK